MPSYETYKSGPRAGQPKTLTDRVVRFITEGLKRVELLSNSGKYRTFTGAEGTGNKWFVGKGGAVRAGKNSSNSISITDRIHALMEKWEVANDK